MADNKPILYNYFRSSCSWRVRIALELKSIDYEYRSVNLIKDGGEQFTPEFTKINPKQEVPALLIDGILIVQSLAIIEYLDETRPNGPRLLPKDPAKRAKARAIAEIINSGIQPYQNANVLKRLVQMGGGEEKKNEWLAFYINKGLRALEEALKETSGGKYCVGDEVSLADLCLVPQVYGAKRFGISLEDYPNIVRVNSELEKLPEFMRAHAHRQVDCPAELREQA